MPTVNGENSSTWKEIKSIEDVIFDVKYGKPEHITFHWSFSRYYACFPEFHFNVLGNGKIFQNIYSPVCKKLGHTWENNSGNIAISASSMFECNWKDYGAYPVKDVQKDQMAWLAALLMKRFDWDMNGLEERKFHNFITQKEDSMPIYRVMVHGEWACLANPPYGPFAPNPDSRWELWKERHEMRERTEQWLGKLTVVRIGHENDKQ